MVRKYATMTPHEIREADGDGLEEAKKLHLTAKMLDRLDRIEWIATEQSTRELAGIVKEFIKLQLSWHQAARLTVPGDESKGR